MNKGMAFFAGVHAIKTEQLAIVPVFQENFADVDQRNLVFLRQLKDHQVVSFLPAVNIVDVTEPR